MDRVGLRPLERLVLAAAVVGGQTRKEFSNQAFDLIHAEFDNAISELSQSPPPDYADFNPNQLVKLMSNLLCDVPQDAPVLFPPQRQSLILAVQSKLGKEAMSPILYRLFSKLR